MASLELQRFCLLLKFHVTELRAKYRVGVCAFTHGCCRQVPQPGPAARPRSPWAAWPEPTTPQAHNTGVSTDAPPGRSVRETPKSPRVVSGMNQGKPP